MVLHALLSETLQEYIPKDKLPKVQQIPLISFNALIIYISVGGQSKGFAEKLILR